MGIIIKQAKQTQKAAYVQSKKVASAKTQVVKRVNEKSSQVFVNGLLTGLENNRKDEEKK